MAVDTPSPTTCLNCGPLVFLSTLSVLPGSGIVCRTLEQHTGVDADAMWQSAADQPIPAYIVSPYE